MLDLVVTSVEPAGRPPDDSLRPRFQRELRSFFASTPGRLTLLGLVLVVITVAAGLLAAATIERRESRLSLLLTETEPLANSSQTLYGALSVADAAAATAFISGGLEHADVRARYTQSIGEASADVVSASAGLDPSDTTGHLELSSISTQLSVYTGLIETARANNRIGNPVGSAYLSEASNLMQTSILPVAQQLHAERATAVTKVQQDSQTPPWWPIAAFVVVLTALVLTQWHLARRSRRTFNGGLVLASIAVAAALVWIVVVGVVSAVSTGRALESSAYPLHQLTTARIAAQQARTVETLALARRDAAAVRNDTFAGEVRTVESVLAGLAEHDRAEVDPGVLSRALDARQTWVSAHSRMSERLGIGDYTGASDIATGPGPEDSAAAYGALDRELTQAMIDTRDSLRSNIAHAAKVFALSAPGTTALTALGVAGILIGFWPRLREYR
ncbi:hypothetical protein ABH922_003603 [Rhodococcus sp. 27YEA15]|uniref:hypothetical protein n=1 Tax=Rhodococcus sp. 27YEA15 TaxID=3156259 RepID=UPI003C7CE60A